MENIDNLFMFLNKNTAKKKKKYFPLLNWSQYRSYIFIISLHYIQIKIMQDAIYLLFVLNDMHLIYRNTVLSNKHGVQNKHLPSP